MTCSYKNYQEKCIQELRKHSKSDSKKYWNILNRLNKLSKDEPDIPIETFYEYFKNLYADNVNDEPNNYEIDDVDLQLFVTNNPRIDDIINYNYSVTEDEVKRAVSKLKMIKHRGQMVLSMNT